MQLLEEIGCKVGTFLAIGTDKQDFFGFENMVVPLEQKRTYDDWETRSGQVMKDLYEYLMMVALPHFQKGKQLLFRE